MSTLTMATLVQLAASFFGILAAVFWTAAAVVRVPIDLRAYMAADRSVRVAGLDEMQIGFAWQRSFNALGAGSAAIAMILQVLATWLV
jgi:hypothetical protein